MPDLSRPLRIAIVLLALVMLAGAVPVSAMPPSGAPVEHGLGVAIESMRQLATDSRDNKKKKIKKTTRPRRGLPIDLGKDGRLTMMLMGSDWRPESGGERIDVLMVATIDPVTGKAAIVSIPRDMSGIPLAGGSSSGGMRVNSIYFIRYRDPALKHDKIDRKALGKFSNDIAKFLGTEIDYWAFTRFGSFASLINTLGGVKLDVEDEVLDSSYHHGNSRGVWFPSQDDYKLKGDPKCKPKPRKCRSALVYARSRKGSHGSQGNSDYRRADRQQDIVMAGVKRVLDDFGSGLPLLGLLLGARQHVETNLPTTAEAAGQLYALLSKVKLPRSNMKVLGPGTFAIANPGFTIQPNVPAVRAWVDQAFYKVKQRKKAKARAGAQDAAERTDSADSTES